jgi:hypothetical protein
VRAYSLVWNISGIVISRNDLQMFKDIREIASAAVGVPYFIGAQFDDAGLLEASQRLRGDDHVLQRKFFYIFERAPSHASESPYRHLLKLVLNNCGYLYLWYSSAF